jgi:hypothetical protein
LKTTISDLSDDLKDVETEITDINKQVRGIMERIMRQNTFKICIKDHLSRYFIL